MNNLPRKLQSVLGVKLETGVRGKVYPVSDSKKAPQRFETVSFGLTPEQSIELARNLLVGAKDWKEIKVTGYRLRKRTDGTNRITVTGYR